MDSDSAEFESALCRSGLDANLAKRLASEEFTEASFAKVDAALLRAIGFKGSEILQILDIKSKGLSPAVEPESELDNIVDDDVLRPYFINPKELENMSDYEKQPLFSQLGRWKEAQVKDPKFASLLKPSFVITYEKHLEKEARKKRVASDQETPETNPKRHARISTLEARSSETPAQKASGSSKASGGQRESSTFNSLFSSAGSSQGPSVSKSASSSASVLSLGSTPAPVSSSTSSLRQSTSGSALALDVLMDKNRKAANLASSSKASTRVSWSIEDIVPKFDVQTELNRKLDKHPRGKAILKCLEENTSPLASADRKLVVRVLTKWLYKAYVSDPKQVTSDMKEELAKSIAKTFSKTFWIVSENGAPWANLFDREENTGFIVNAARPVQKKNQQRKSKKGGTSADEDNEYVEDNDGIDRLALIVPANRSETKNEILRGMRKYYYNRNAERNQGKTITFFLSKYIHFTSYGGEVILEEFDRMHPNVGNNMPTRFLTVMPKILGLPAKRDIELTLNDNTLLSLFLLSQYLPHDIPKKTDGEVEHSWALEEDLMVVLQTKDNVDDKIIDKRNSTKGSVQPYLILIRSDLDEKIVRYFLVLDSKAVELSCVNLSSNHATLQAFDVLMKAYVVFNVHHPYGWRNTLNFVQHYLLGVEELRTSKGRKSKAAPTQSAL